MYFSINIVLQYTFKKKIPWTVTKSSESQWMKFFAVGLAFLSSRARISLSSYTLNSSDINNTLSCDNRSRRAQNHTEYASNLPYIHVMCEHWSYIYQNGHVCVWMSTCVCVFVCTTSMLVFVDIVLYDDCVCIGIFFRF